MVYSILSESVSRCPIRIQAKRESRVHPNTSVRTAQVDTPRELLPMPSRSPAAGPGAREFESAGGTTTRGGEAMVAGLAPRRDASVRGAGASATSRAGQRHRARGAAGLPWREETGAVRWGRHARHGPGAGAARAPRVSAWCFSACGAHAVTYAHPHLVEWPRHRTTGVPFRPRAGLLVQRAPAPAAGRPSAGNFFIFLESGQNSEIPA